MNLNVSLDAGSLPVSIRADGVCVTVEPSAPLISLVHIAITAVKTKTEEE